MNDRFKFLVWDEDAHEYNSHNAVALNKSGELLAQSVIGFIHYPDVYSIEQCTGLKDKNGRLIYEGDIIRFDGWPGTPSHIVAWNPRTCRWVLRLPKDINLENTASLCLGDVADNEYIIVGNIHEAKWGIESEVKE